MPPIPRNRASTVCSNNDRLLTVRAIDPQTHREYLFLPGGGIEIGEAPADAAVRETLEETGYAVELVGDPIELAYEFTWGATAYACKTFFFAAKLINPAAAPVKVLGDDPNLHEAQWIDVHTVDQVFNYHPQIWEAVHQLLDRISLVRGPLGSKPSNVRPV